MQKLERLFVSFTLHESRYCRGVRVLARMLRDRFAAALVTAAAVDGFVTRGSDTAADLLHDVAADVQAATAPVCACGIAKGQ